MKLVSIKQRTTFHALLETATAAVLSTVIVGTLIVLTTPGYLAATRQLVFA